MSSEEIQQIFYRKLDVIDEKYGYGKNGYDSIKTVCKLEPQKNGEIKLKALESISPFPDAMLEEAIKAWEETAAYC